MNAQLTFQRIENLLQSKGFEIVRKDYDRPWGGFVAINENQASGFLASFFPNFNTSLLAERQKLSPKILMVAPQKRLSWQYHHRRSEVWKVLEGPIGIIRSKTDVEMPIETFTFGNQITFELEERHRLVGLKEWGVIAEIWIHTTPSNPSDENDIVRLQDDFARSTPSKND